MEVQVDYSVYNGKRIVKAKDKLVMGYQSVKECITTLKFRIH
jgi:hypothetical protein